MGIIGQQTKKLNRKQQNTNHKQITLHLFKIMQSKREKPLRFLTYLELLFLSNTKTVSLYLLLHITEMKTLR